MPSKTQRVYHDLNDLPSQRRVLTVGTFDGVHRGHQKLLNATADRADMLHLTSLVLTFEPVPAQVLRPDRFPGRICSPEEKLDLIGRSSVSSIVVLPFTLPFSKQTAELFMADIASKIEPVEMWVGEGFALGRDRGGTIERLSSLAAEYGFRLQALPRLQDRGSVISSSEIRRSLVNGDVSRAGELLGRRFSLSGKVIHGAHLGRTIGFPTANVEPDSDLLIPKDGIYASIAFIDSDNAEQDGRPAMTYIGTRPTVNTGSRLVETHLLDFDGDLYGRELRADFVAHLRDDERFDSLESMVEQLAHDEHFAREILRSELLISPRFAHGEEKAKRCGD